MEEEDKVEEEEEEERKKREGRRSKMSICSGPKKMDIKQNFFPLR